MAITKIPEETVKQIPESLQESAAAYAVHRPDYGPGTAVAAKSSDPTISPLVSAGVTTPRHTHADNRTPTDFAMARRIG